MNCCGKPRPLMPTFNFKTPSFFSQYFADVTLLDSQGRTALWYARESSSRECEEILRYNGCQSIGRSLSCSGSSNSGDLTS